MLKETLKILKPELLELQNHELTVVLSSSKSQCYKSKNNSVQVDKRSTNVNYKQSQVVILILNI